MSAVDNLARAVEFAPPDPVDATPDFGIKPWIPRDPATIQPRPWLYGRALLRGAVSALVAPGGTGKSSLALAEAVAMAVGCTGPERRTFLGTWCADDLRVAYIGGEDDEDERERRLAAVMARNGLTPAHLAGRLFCLSSDDAGLCIAEMDGARAVVTDDVERLKAVIRHHRLDVLIIDPFVSAHSVSENDNGAIDTVVKSLRSVARQTRCAIEVVHHVAKLRGDDLTQDSARGASSFVDATRSTRGLVRMTAKEGAAVGIHGAQLREYVRLVDLKGNYSPPEAARWFNLESVTIANGEAVGVPVPWTYPGALDTCNMDDVRIIMAALQLGGPHWKDAQRAGNGWAGDTVAAKLGMNPVDDKAAIRRMLDAWEASELLQVIRVPATGRANRESPAYTVNTGRIP